MTRKTVLASWAGALGADLPAGVTAAQLEAGIDDAIANLIAPSDSPTFGEALRNNWAVLQAEALPTVKVIATNLRS